MSNNELVFEIGDYVKLSDTFTEQDSINTGIQMSNVGEVFRIAYLDSLPWSAYNVSGIITACGMYIPNCLLIKVNSPQQKLDQLKKYFESGNGISVDRATIKASDFWAIYNS